jgi:hypothetical protein
VIPRLQPDERALAGLSVGKATLLAEAKRAAGLVGVKSNASTVSCCLTR